MEWAGSGLVAVQWETSNITTDVLVLWICWFVVEVAILDARSGEPATEFGHTNLLGVLAFVRNTRRIQGKYMTRSASNEWDSTGCDGF
jgi:hypothetical protein